MAERANIARADKAQIIQRLYNHAIGWAALGQAGALLQTRLPKMTIEQAQGMVQAGDLYLDYLGGRKIGVDLRNEEVDFYVYDRDCNGPGSARKALEGLEGVVFL